MDGNYSEFLDIYSASGRTPARLPQARQSFRLAAPSEVEQRGKRLTYFGCKMNPGTSRQ
jgi:hypothetical protein